MKNEKGITLIALIITIIIMLILVGVTINYSLNGGLITKAKEAASQTQIEADKEILMLEALGTIDTNGDLHLDEMETPAGFTKVSVGKYTKGDYEYIVNPTTGAVVARKTSGEDGESDSESSSGSEPIIDRSVAGTYTSYLEENGSLNESQYIFELDENNNVSMNFANEFYFTAKYEFDEINNLVTFTDIEGSSDVDSNVMMRVLFFNNNKALFGAGGVFMTTNGFNGIEEIPQEVIGNYVDSNENQASIVTSTTYELLYGAPVGLVQYVQGGSSFTDAFINIGNDFYYFEQDIEISSDYSTLTIDGVVYTKTN